MALESQQRVVMIHAAAIVNHADQPLAARFRFDANGTRACIQSVFQQFLYDGRRTLDHFSRGNFISDCFRKYADSAHGRCLAQRGLAYPEPGNVAMDAPIGTRYDIMRPSLPSFLLPLA